jgi:ribosomal protein L19E
MVDVVNCGQGRIAMSTEALNRIIKEVNALTPQERRELIDRLADEEQNSPLREWLTKARKVRAELPPTSDSVDILRGLREVRSRR